MSALVADAAAMDRLAEQLFLELHDLRAQLAQARYQQTLLGRYFNASGHVLMFYGVYRVVMAAANTALRRVGKIDPVTRTLQIAVDYLGLALDVHVWSQYVSFLLVGLVIISSIRSFLIQLTKVSGRQRETEVRERERKREREKEREGERKREKERERERKRERERERKRERVGRRGCWLVELDRRAMGGKER